MAEYQVVIVDQNGVKYGELPRVSVSDITEILNDVGSATFELGINDPAAANIQLLTREIQVWRDGSLVWWGVPTRARADSQKLSVQAQELMWYFKRRFLGKPGRMNLLTNPEFEQSVINVPPVGWSPWNDISAATTDVQHVLGTKSVRLDNLTPNGDNFIYQNIFIPESNATYYLAGECFVPSRTDNAFENRGIGLAVFNPSLQIIDEQYMPIDETTPLNEWTPIQLSIYVPEVSSGSILQVRLYSSVPSVFWDAIYLAMDEQIKYTGADMSDIAVDLIDRAQVPPDYSDLNIDTHYATPSGLKRTLSYKLTDHNNVFDIVSNLTKEEDKTLGSVDISMEITAATRTFTVWPRKGAYKAEVLLEWGKNLADYSYDLDGEKTSSSIIVQGDGNGPTRLERGYVDASGLNGLILQDLFQAPANTLIDTLDALAYQSFQRVHSLVQILEVTTSDPSLIGQLTVGDTIPIRIFEGWVQINDIYRIVELSLNPQTDQLRLTLNLANQ